MRHWGEQTELALRNFTVSGEPFPLAVIHQLAIIKAEAARINATLRTFDLDARDVEAIVRAADAVADGDYDDEFRVDVFQTGSGTSSNMNVNEVVSSVAMELANTGNPIHPNDHVNAAQSSNDTVPTAVHLAVALAMRDTLFPAMLLLVTELRSSATKFHHVVKIGRTHLMDAVPVTLGQEFGGMARAVDLARGSMDVALTRLMELPLGGTATGTGLNAPAGYAEAMIQALRKRTGFGWVEATDHFEAQSGRDALVSVSAACRGLGISLFKIANDLRWMASGPIGGLGEITLPALQAGSSIMPGKVNPVIPEVVCQVAAQVIGNDAAVAFAATTGSFELNVMIPVIARNVLASVNLLARAMQALADQCIRGLVADEVAMRSRVERSPMVATALNEAIGYQRAKKLVDDSIRSGISVAELAVREGLLDQAQTHRLTDVMRLAYPHAD
jgi:fumarate hydratase, class II